MRKISFIFYLLSFICICGIANAGSYRAAIVADMDSGRVLFSDRANDANYPASLTKIMTLYLTFDALEHDRLHLNDELIVSSYAAGAQPTKLGISAGSKITVEDAIRAVCVISANDIARVLAENLKGGKEGNFASLMTQVGTEIGLSNTNFENASGLPNEDHESTARDVALMAMAVYKHFPQYWKYFSIHSWTYNGKTYTNGNRLLNTYPGCDGMKTGFTNASKYSLVATAVRGGKHIMAVVLGASDKDYRAAIATKLLNNGFDADDGAAFVAMDATADSATSENNNVPGAQPVAPKQTVVVSDNSVARSQNDTATTTTTNIQFGAFGSRSAAENAALRVKTLTGVKPVVEQYDTLFRVRAYGVSSDACTAARAGGIDCYLFK